MSHQTRSKKWTIKCSSKSHRQRHSLSLQTTTRSSSAGTITMGKAFAIRERCVHSPTESERITKRSCADTGKSGSNARRMKIVVLPMVGLIYGCTLSLGQDLQGIISSSRINSKTNKRPMLISLLLYCQMYRHHKKSKSRKMYQFIMLQKQPLSSKNQ